MPIESAQKLQEEVIALLKRYSGRRSIELDQMVSRDVGIYGGDGVQILDELEDRFGVDLHPLIDAHTVFPPPTRCGRLLGRKHGHPYTDLTVGELIDYIASGTLPADSGRQA